MNPSPETVAAAIARGLASARDPAQPGDADKQPANYALLGEAFRQSAWQHLSENGDDSLSQASNKAWGLVAETVKAISAQHGGVIHAHRSIWQVARELADLARDAGDTENEELIRTGFRTARSLHTNFYENEETAREVELGLQLCERLSERLYELYWTDQPLT